VAPPIATAQSVPATTSNPLEPKVNMRDRRVTVTTPRMIVGSRANRF
jgi:hypothetical protein